LVIRVNFSLTQELDVMQKAHKQKVINWHQIKLQINCHYYEYHNENQHTKITWICGQMLGEKQLANQMIDN